MRATHEITVDRKEFEEAARWLGRKRADQAKETTLYFDGGAFIVETPLAQTKLKSLGRWETAVAVNAGVLKRLATKLPKERDLTLVYFDGKLAVGPVSLSARVAT